jgi:hypothetical protein
MLDGENKRLSDAGENEWLVDLLNALEKPFFVDMADLHLEVRLVQRLKEVLTALPDLDFNVPLRPEDVVSILLAVSDQIPATGSDILDSLPLMLMQDEDRFCPAGIVRLILCKAALRLGFESSTLLEALMIEAYSEESRLRLEIRRRSGARL